MSLPPKHIPFQPYTPDKDSLTAAKHFRNVMQQRRSVRFFSDKHVERRVIEEIIKAAGTAPSGANKQPWRFVAVQDAVIKREIRIAAEAEEREFYERRASETWKNDLAAIGTDADKPFLEIAPWLIIVFKLMKDDNPETESDQMYYVNESVGIATGLLLAAAQHAGLVTLTHTPSPMKFLSEVLERPDHERAFLLIPVGYPADDCVVPDIHRKSLDQIMVIDRGEA